MRSLLVAFVSGCLALVVPCSAWARGAVYTMTNVQGHNQIVAYSRGANGTLNQVQTISTHGGGSGIQFGGADADDTLGSQGSLLLDREHGLLFAVNTENTGENLLPNGLQDCNQGSISTFVIRPNGRLTFAGKVASGGLFPDSLTLRGNVLYVLNAGGGAASACGMAVNKNPNVTGFYVFPDGKMVQLPFSTRPIDPGPDGPAGFLNCDTSNGLPPCGQSPPLFVRSPGQVGFTPDGRHVVVTVKGTNSIYVFPYGLGYLGNPNVFAFKDHEDAMVQPTYFGFTFDASGNLIVTEPFGKSATFPAGGASALSSFTIGRNGSLTPISSHVADGQTASCWLAVDVEVLGGAKTDEDRDDESDDRPFGAQFEQQRDRHDRSEGVQYAYTTNNVTGSISSFTVASDGTLELLEEQAAVLQNGGATLGPNDLQIVKDKGRSFLYVVVSADKSVYAYRINDDGTLTLKATYPITAGDLTEATAQGLAAY